MKIEIFMIRRRVGIFPDNSTLVNSGSGTKPCILCILRSSLESIASVINLTSSSTLNFAPCPQVNGAGVELAMITQDSFNISLMYM